MPGTFGNSSEVISAVVVPATLSFVIDRSAGSHPPGDHQPITFSPVLGIVVGQTHMSFKRPGAGFVVPVVVPPTSSPRPPNIHLPPLLSVQVIGKSRPPGELSFAVANGGCGIGLPDK